ncbi:hypothetical protein EHI96_20295 [Cronobacter malonaticus]|uniref:hypothetical protein n=1 Tax=Cronobacter malonaticus TaxID=413503 RepID=UPI001375ABF2|nr:hypothetical protein [Cronobacter malonaticus]NCI02157.1 hypothetical protein [Cronobacter malonaticus]
MKSSVDDSVAAVEEMKRTVAGVEQASTEVTTSLEALAKANIDLALRQDEDQYKQSVTNAKISTTQKTFADDISAMASKVEEIRAEIGDNIRASITEETTSRVEADKAIASQITRLEARLTVALTQAGFLSALRRVAQALRMWRKPEQISVSVLPTVLNLI